jgi:tetratricopeptide (TPR) repeat protein
MPLLEYAVILELHEAAIAAGLSRSREALIAGLDLGFVAGIRGAPSPAEQLLVDLHALNEAGARADGRGPLGIWLANAARLAGPRSQAAVFERARDALSVGASSSPSRATGSSSTDRVSIARLPATGDKVFGREAELRWLDQCWRKGAHVASIVAWGGVGKSALVNAWLAQMGAERWRGAERVYGWSFYRQGTDPHSSSDEFVDAALRWFGDPDPKEGSAWDKGERLAALVRRERTLLILDGVEPLQWGLGVQEGKLKDPALEALIKELGAQNNGLCLITTRISLADLPAGKSRTVRAKDLDQLSPEAGAALLEARGATGTPEELREASREYKGHGLALTLLGSYLDEVAAGDIRQRKEIGPLMVDERQGGHARRVMSAYEPWLGKPEVEILRMIGLFDRSAGAGEIAALRAEPAIPGLRDVLAGASGREWNKAVAKLRRAGLLLAEPGDRLDAHPLVREHFGEQLRREQPEAWREGHGRLYEHLRDTAKKLPDTIEEMAPLYAAVVHGCRAGKNQEAFVEVYTARIQRRDEHFFNHFNKDKLGAFSSDVAVLSAFFDPPWAQLAPGLSEPTQAEVLGIAGFALGVFGRLSEAARLLQISLERYDAQGDWTNASLVAFNITQNCQASGELGTALLQGRKSVELADKSASALWCVLTRATLAAALHATGLREQARTLFEEAERMQKERSPAYPLLYSLQGFLYSDFLLDQDRHAEVRQRAAQTLEMAKEEGGLRDIALDHLSLARAHLLAAQRTLSGDLAAAASYLRQAVDGLRRTGNQHYLPLALLARAHLYTHTRAFPAARHDLDEALALANRCGLRLHLADAHLGHARLALAEGAPAAAAPHLAAAGDIIRVTGYHRRDAELAALEAAAASPPATRP